MKALLRYDLFILLFSIVFLLSSTVFPLHQASLIIFMISIVLLGIPHGALDHLIAFNGKKRSAKSQLAFYANYLGLIVIVFCSWYFLPLISFLLFLIISAHHFGQSQLFYIKVDMAAVKHAFYLCWGIFVLSIIIWLNYTECFSIFQSLEWLNVSQWMSPSIWKWSSIISGSGILAFFGFAKHNNLISRQRLFFETGLLLVLISFASFTNAVITFSVYFGLWHSLRSLILEYKSLKAALARYSFRQFINDILPFSLLAIVFLTLSFYFFSNFEMNLSPYMIFIIVISALTVPHLFIMNDLYERNAA